MLEMLLEHKYLYEELTSVKEKTSLKEKFNQYTETFSYMETLTDTEKELICKGNDIGDSVEDITNYNIENVIIKKYENSYIEDGIKKYCVQFNVAKTNEIIADMETSYDFPILEGSVARQVIKDVEIEIQKLEKEGY